MIFRMIDLSVSHVYSQSVGRSCVHTSSAHNVRVHRHMRLSFRFPAFFPSLWRNERENRRINLMPEPICWQTLKISWTTQIRTDDFRSSNLYLTQFFQLQIFSQFQTNDRNRLSGRMSNLLPENRGERIDLQSTSSDQRISGNGTFHGRILLTGYWTIGRTGGVHCRNRTECVDRVDVKTQTK